MYVNLKSHLNPPFHAKILVCIKRNERGFHAIRLIDRFLPDIPFQIFILTVIEEKDMIPEHEAYQDLYHLAKDSIHHQWTQIIVRTGETVNEIIKTAHSLRCDLVVVPYSPEPSRYLFQPISIADKLLTLCPFPIYFIPDPNQCRRSCFPIEKAVVDIDPASTNYQSAAYAIRAARLLSKKIKICCKTKFWKTQRIKNLLDILAMRYLDEYSRSNTDLNISTGNFIEYNLDLFRHEKPQLYVFTVSSTSSYPSPVRLMNIRRILPHLNTNVLIVKKISLLNHLEKKFQHIYDQISDYDIALVDTNRTENFPTAGITNEMSLSTDFFLGRYSQKGIEHALKRYGFIDKLRKMGFENIDITVDTSDPFRQRLQIHAPLQSPDLPLVDIVLSRKDSSLLPPTLQRYLPQKTFFLSIEWLCMQDPLRPFTSIDRPFPGQDYPGLGLGWQVMMLLKFMTKRIEASGIYTHPEYYHNARLFHRAFEFINPIDQGILLSIDRDTFPLPIIDTSWAVHHGLIKDLITNTPFQWTGHPQLMPLHSNITSYFNTDEYRQTFLKTLELKKYGVDYDAIEKLKSAKKFYQFPLE